MSILHQYLVFDGKTNHVTQIGDPKTEYTTIQHNGIHLHIHEDVSLGYSSTGQVIVVSSTPKDIILIRLSSNEYQIVPCPVNEYILFFDPSQRGNVFRISHQDTSSITEWFANPSWTTEHIVVMSYTYPSILSQLSSIVSVDIVSRSVSEAYLTLPVSSNSIGLAVDLSATEANKCILEFNTSASFPVLTLHQKLLLLQKRMGSSVDPLKNTDEIINDMLMSVGVLLIHDS